MIGLSSGFVCRSELLFLLFCDFTATIHQVCRLLRHSNVRLQRDRPSSPPPDGIHRLVRFRSRGSVIHRYRQPLRPKPERDDPTDAAGSSGHQGRPGRP